MSIRLNHSIVIQVNTSNNDLQEENWQNIILCFAKIENVLSEKLRNLEELDFGVVIAEEALIFTIRYNPELKENMRVFFRGNHYMVKKIVNVDYKDKFLQLLTIKV